MFFLTKTNLLWSFNYLWHYCGCSTLDYWYGLLDPRTKLLVLFTMSLFVLGGLEAERMAAFMPILCAVPAVALISARQYKTALIYVTVYMASYLFMACCAKIGEELSAAALTRGLGVDVRRTNICTIGFKAQDVVVIALCAVPYVWVCLP